MGRNGRRARKSGGLLELVLRSDWPVAGALALVVAVVGFWMMPAWLSRSPMLAQLPATLKPFVWGLFGFFMLTAIIKFRFAHRAESERREQESPASSATTSRAGDSAGLTPAKPVAWSLELIQSLEWKRFEDLCAEFYREKGICCVTTPLGPDGGIDIRLMQGEGKNKDATTAIVQCKAWGDRLVGVKPVRELLGVMTHEKIPKAFFMSSGGFTDDARSVAVANRITLLDGKRFLDMIEHLSGASRQRLLVFATAGDYATPSCPGCGVKMVAREDAKGKFWGCVAFPKCRGRLQISGNRKISE
jgi:restriction system protein